MDKINQKLQEARIDRERQFHYLQAVVEQVDTGIIACDQQGNVVILNNAARELLGINKIKHLSALTSNYPGLAVFFSPEHTPKPSPVKIKKDNNDLILAVKTGLLRFDETVITLISFQNIKPELEAGELDAWRKLIRIQRHEIINSMTPITTLTTAIRRRLKKGNIKRSLHEITDEDIDDTIISVDAIEERGRGLIDFVERFKSLTNVPELKIDFIPLKKRH